MQALGQVDDADGVPFQDLLVQRTDAHDAHHVAPVGILLQGGGNFRLTPHRYNLVEVVEGGELQDKTLREGAQVEFGQYARGGDERSVEGVRLAVQVIDAAREAAQGTLELGLERLHVVEEYFLCVYGPDFLLGEGEVPVDDFLHLLLEAVHVVIRKEIVGMMAVFSRRAVLQFAVDAAGKGVVGKEHLVRKNGPYGVLEHKAQGTDVAAAPLFVGVADEFHRPRENDRIIQFFQFVVNHGRQHRQLCTGLGLFQGGHPDAPG